MNQNQCGNGTIQFQNRKRRVQMSQFTQYTHFSSQVAWTYLKGLHFPYHTIIRFYHTAWCFVHSHESTTLHELNWQAAFKWLFIFWGFLMWFPNSQNWKKKWRLRLLFILRNTMKLSLFVQLYHKLQNILCLFCRQNVTNTGPPIQGNQYIMGTLNACSSQNQHSIITQSEY